MCVGSPSAPSRVCHGAEPLLTHDTLQRMALDEREEVKEHLEDVEEGEETDMDERRQQVPPSPSPLSTLRSS